MKARFLFPSIFRILGILMAIPGFILGYLVVFKEYKIPDFVLHLRDHASLDRAEYENFTNELALALVVVGLVFIAFSKVKREDELTARIRLNALYWAILTNYIIYAIWFLMSGSAELFHWEMMSSALSGPLHFSLNNFFLPLSIFIGRFYFLLNKSKNEYVEAPVHFLPNRPYGLIGKALTLILLLPAIYALFDFFGANWLDAVYYFLPLAMLLWIYSKERVEDEYINSIKLSSMQIAIYVNYVVLLLANFFCYGILFLLVQQLNLITIPLIFLIRFQYLLYKLRSQDSRGGATLSCL
ncbi:hypothetical protein [Mucilaginibacter myungsuensis]|uniref:Uncharacterized protein n=1 Tax=Mucilaginibacter myungsuensis TaxID=649104 RepID=A0A929L539_9SPHI|nr:hypothetical protein [Mucilaginibacter myungsuensis]MBE9663391.1 hypothetical protein [Mucilaginibacter myungsuensis]MDN3600128.1 hypothetical protein [Mucilaginibacter myungsuensis]